MSIAKPEVYRHFYKAALAEVRADRQAYEDDVRDYYESGDGRSPEWEDVDIFDGAEVIGTRRVNVGGMGYRYPYCPHGMSLWTDYDNICGWCEESFTVYEEARMRAREKFYRFAKRFDWLMSAPADIRNTFGGYSDLMDWAFRDMPKG